MEMLLMARIIDGKAIAAQIKAEAKLEVEKLKAKAVTPGLAVVLVGENPASQTYVAGKVRDCAEVGITSGRHDLSADTTMTELLALIKTLAEDKRIHGILVQLPLPPHLDEAAVIAAIPPEKDVDCFTAENTGRVMLGEPRFMPCTPAGIIELLRRSGVAIEGKECVVVGRSNIVGKPMAMLLLRENGTVTICHSKTKNLAEITRRADILVAAIGRAKYIKADMIKPGAAVIDVGMNRDEDGRLCGDVDYIAAEAIAGHITPVPGGVGPMTRAILMKNTVEACKLKFDN
jgi:methylenetetrahydrofolate dehydrogenase (NADP+)/methenyltetrahydrofolate cyclohydrolase